jgi:hypothetical protein
MIAFGIYILGVSVILFVRPAFMFRASSGTWKEFGLGGGVDSGQYTIFPFWMFAILWALVSYALASMATLFFGTAAALSMAQPNSINAVNDAVKNIATPISKVPPPSISVADVQNSVVNASGSGGVPGYYVLETPKVGMPKYVYFGPNPPTLENVTRIGAVV